MRTRTKRRPTPEVVGRLAKLIVQQCFRNTNLEAIHAGDTPLSNAGDYADVVVKTPTQEIPWPNLSRISQDEMRELMRESVDKTAVFVSMLLDEERRKTLLALMEAQDLVSEWDSPRGAS